MKYDLLKDAQDNLPNIPARKLYQMFQAINARYKAHWRVGISRKEHKRFNLSERQVGNFLTLLKKNNNIEMIDQVTARRNGFLCNVYKISNFLLEGLKTLRMYSKSKFVNPTEYVKSHFNYRETRERITFKHNNHHFVIVKKNNRIYDSPYNWLIYHCEANKIIHPLDLHLCS